MGRRPCCSKEGLNRGAWTALEDKILIAYIKAHGEGNWRNLPKRAGLKRCGKSCRLRWLNYLRPDIKRGNISHDEEELIIRLHKLLGNRWSLIAGRLPGRTDNEIKNYWNTTLGKKANAQSSPSPQSKNIRKKLATEPSNSLQPTQVIRTRATRCTRVVIPPLQHQLPLPPENQTPIMNPAPPVDLTQNSIVANCGQHHHNESNNHLDLDQFLNLDSHELFQPSNDFSKENYMGTSPDHHQCLPSETVPLMFNDLTASTVHSLEDSVNLDFDSLALLLASEEWP